MLRQSHYRLLAFLLLIAAAAQAVLQTVTSEANEPPAATDSPDIASESAAEAPVCHTSACVALTAGISSKMNLSADPCVDFFNYACGNFPVNYKYDPDEVFKSAKRTDPVLFQNSFSVMRNQLRSNLFEVLVLDWVVNSTDAEVRDLYNLTRMLFRSCTKWMRYRSIKSDTLAGKRFFSSVLQHLLEGVRPSKRSNKTIESILARIVNTDVHTMFDVRVPESYLRELRKGNKDRLKRASRVVVTADTKQYKSSADFEPFLEFFSTLEKASVLSLENNSDTFNRIVKELRNTERYANWTENCSISTERSKYKILELEVLSRCANPRDPFSWSMFFDELLQADYDPDALVELENPVRVMSFVSYFKKRTTYATGARLSSYHTILIVDWLLSFAKFFPKRQEHLWEEAPLRGSTMDKAVGGPVDACMKWTKDLLSPVVEKMYQKAYHADNFDHVQRLIELVQNATAASVLEQEWIEPGTKELILEKLMSLKHVIGFDVLSDKQLKQFYAPAIASFQAGSYWKASVDKHFGRLFSIALSASARKKFNVMSDSGPVTAFLTLSPLTANAYNYMRRNQVVFPMGILSPPMYHRDYPDYISLGGLGAVVGHEIGHAFDIKGHRLDQRGVRGRYWESATEAEYLRRAECVRSRYAAYELVPGLQHGSNTTLGNDIADLMGLRSAFGALQLLGDADRSRVQELLPNLPVDLTPERMFFVQAAQAWCVKAEPDALVRKFKGIKHSPPHLRVRGMLENSADFARTFQCKAGQPMHPSGKCEFW